MNESNVLYDIDTARLLVSVQHELRYNAYPYEQAMIQDKIQQDCPDVGEIIFSGNHDDNVIILNPKGTCMDRERINQAALLIVSDIYQRYIINKYGKSNKMSMLSPTLLFYIIDMDDQVKIYI